MEPTMEPRLALFRHARDAKTFAAGETIFRCGDPGDVMYVVREGTVEVFVEDRIVDTLGPDSVFGEMALIDKQPRSATAVARTDCSLVPVSEDRFKQLVQQTPNFAIDVMRIIAYRLRRMNERP